MTFFWQVHKSRQLERDLLAFMWWNKTVFCEPSFVLLHCMRDLARCNCRPSVEPSLHCSLGSASEQSLCALPLHLLICSANWYTIIIEIIFSSLGCPSLSCYLCMLTTMQFVVADLLWAVLCFVTLHARPGQSLFPIWFGRHCFTRKRFIWFEIIRLTLRILQKRKRKKDIN